MNINWVFKSCYDKDFRSSPDSFQGVGLDEGLKILELTRDTFNITVVSDFSDSKDALAVGEICDLIEIPAYLCRQTSILKAGALTGRSIHLKKGNL